MLQDAVVTSGELAELVSVPARERDASWHVRMVRYRLLEAEAHGLAHVNLDRSWVESLLALIDRSRRSH